MRCLSRVGVTLDVGGGRHSGTGIEGSLSVSLPGFDNEVILDAQHRVDIVSINWKHIEHIRRNENISPSPDFGAVHSRLNHDPQMSRTFDRLWQLDAISDAVEVESSILWISHRLDAWRDWPHRRPSLPVERLSRAALNRCIERIDASTGDPASLEELATLCQLSMFHFCRAFKAATGLPPHRYQIVRRIDRARAMLANTALSVAEVANAVGYDDVTYFTRLFRRETGFPPGQWRRERLR